MTTSRRSRTVHLVDIENLVGGSHVAETLVHSVSEHYARVAGVAADDLVIAACSHETFPYVAWAWEGHPRMLVRSGEDGADLALLTALEEERLVERFTRVVVGSGDGIFAEPLSLVQHRGIAVTVVGRRRSMSSRLRLAVRDLRYLSDDLPQAQARRDVA
jgi:hypothetical protein